MLPIHAARCKSAINWVLTITPSWEEKMKLQTKDVNTGEPVVLLEYNDDCVGFLKFFQDKKNYPDRRTEVVDFNGHHFTVKLGDLEDKK